MIAPLATATFPSTQLPTASAIVIKGVSATNSHRVNIFKTTSCPRLRGASFCFPVVAKGRTFLVHASSLTNLQEHWEYPNDGSDSEDEDENEEVEENDLDFESDWEAERGAVTIPNRITELSAGSYEEDLVKEVEQLLEPEEIAILQQNETPNLERISTSKWSPLHTLSLAGQIPFMDRLLENGLNIDLVDKDGLTALHKSIIGKKEAVTSHLLRKGASIHARDLDGATPLHYAVQVGAMQTVKLLIKYKVDVNIADNEGWTPLHVAMQSRNRDIAKVLLVNGADKTRRNKVSSKNEDLIEAAYTKVPTPSPLKTPPPAHVPIKAPVLPAPPVKPPTWAPTPPRNTKECYPPCVVRCSLNSRKNVCLRACVACCDRCKCVPPGQYGNREKCGKCYVNMTTRGGRSKCP